jgi:hypothetical protein
LLVLLGVWGALIPFVGPYFDYQIGTTSTWDWSIDRFWLSVLPGAAAALGGLIMLFSTRRSTASFGGLLALAGGLWFVAGPSVSMLWNDGVQATGAAIGDNGTRVVEWLGFFWRLCPSRTRQSRREPSRHPRRRPRARSRSSGMTAPPRGPRPAGVGSSAAAAADPSPPSGVSALRLTRPPAAATPRPAK